MNKASPLTRCARPWNGSRRRASCRAWGAHRRHANRPDLRHERTGARPEPQPADAGPQLLAGRDGGPVRSPDGKRSLFRRPAVGPGQGAPLDRHPGLAVRSPHAAGSREPPQRSSGPDRPPTAHAGEGPPRAGRSVADLEVAAADRGVTGLLSAQGPGLVPQADGGVPARSAADVRRLPPPEGHHHRRCCSLLRRRRHLNGPVGL